MLKNTKLFFALFFTSIMICPSVWAMPFSVSFLTGGRPDFTISQSFEYELMHDAKNDSFGISTIAEVDANELRALSGVHATSETTDFSFQTYYAPCFWELISFGATVKYHYYKYIDVFAEHNVLGGLFINVNLDDVWNLYLNAGTFGKFTIINNYPLNIRTKDKSVYFKTGCIFTPAEKWKFFFDVSNIAFFEDNILGVFLFDLGVDRKMWRNMALGSDIYFKWEDATVPFDSFNQIALRVNWSLCF